MRRIDLKKANVARSNTIRNINRQIVLNYVRERGPISRAEIAHETALQRSTVSLIVEELRIEGLIEELSGESTGGRPPILLSLRTADAVAIGVDLGTTRTIVATSDLAGRVLDQEEFETDPDATRTTQAIIDRAQRLIRRNKGTIEGIGVSLPGLVDPDGTELFIPTFNWRDITLARDLSEATGLPVTMDNDANAAAQAELWFGRPEIREVRDFILERSALARFKNLSGGRNGTATKNFGHLIDLALRSDGAARTALKETANYLGIGIANLIRGLAPQAVIVGGPIVRAWPVIEADIRKSVETTICRGLPSTRIIASTLGPEPTLMGALSLVLASKFASASVT